MFKVKAEFDTVMMATPEGIVEYAGFIRKITKEENLLSFDKSGVAAVVEYGMRQAGRGDRLSTRFTEIADVLREASYRAAQGRASRVSAVHVRDALAGRRERVSLAQTKMQEAVAEGTILLDVSGSKTGQVNGLAYYDLGDYAFGLPARITASLAMGRAGIVNIEREAEMSGPTHNKGVLILSGYLRALFAQDKPLTLSASVCFEQSYGGVDGDSASSAEVYVLLSALADAPLRQDLAVTGSVNQKGEVQPIGGVNEKIEGWFEACRTRGLTGTQGVLIPALNVPDLMLDDEVVEACRAGKFAVYPISHVSEGIELLAGVPAGERTAQGSYEEGSIHARADAHLRDLAEQIRQFGPGFA
jgi:predicted ATP-dependent protease